MQNIPGLLSWQPLPGEGKPLGISLPRNCQCFLLEPPIINPNEGCREGSVLKWIWKAGMEPHGTNPWAFIPAKTTLEKAHRWVGGCCWVSHGLPSLSFPKTVTASFRLAKALSLFPRAPGGIKHDGEDSLGENIQVILIFVFMQKERKKKKANPIISCWKHWRVWMSHKELEVPVGSFLWLSPFVPVSQMSCPPHWKAIYQWLGFNHWKGKSNLLTLLCCLSSSPPFIPQPPPQILVTIHVAKISAVMSFQAECKLIPLVNVTAAVKQQNKITPRKAINKNLCEN